jgi:PAS domain S-box-containing protein
VEAGLRRFNLHFEFMDLAKHPDPAHRREFGKYLSRKFEQRPIDLIIALHSPAFDFLVEEGRNLFPGVPVINVIAASEFLQSEDLLSSYERRIHPLNRPFVILPYSIDVDSTVKSILSLRPDTRKLVVISGSLLLDRSMRQAAGRGLKAWQGRLLIEALDVLPIEEVLKLVSSLAPKTAVLFVNFSADPDGTAYSPPEVVRRISGAANAPVFGLFDTLLGNGGIVGGVMPTFANEAAKTVRQALEILRGRLPTEPVTISPARYTPVFDWEQLNRWGMDEKKLPSGNMVLNRPRTLWTDYRGFVIGSIAVFLVLTTLLSGLLVQRYFRRAAEASLRQKTDELDQFFNVTLDLLCIAQMDGYFLRLNPAWERILGYTREELMAKQFFEFVHPDDLERTLKAVSALVSEQKLIHFENRYRTKDGTYRWLEWTSAPAGNLIYAAARDLTERLKEEAEGQQRREELAHMTRVAMLGELTTSLAHEINQPLTAILSNAGAAQRFLSQSSPDINEVRQILDDIIRDDRRASEVVRRVRALVRKEKPRHEPLDLNEIIQQVVDLIRGDSLLQGLSIRTDLSPGLATIHGDGIQLQQVILNLILNGAAAMRNTPSGQRKIIVRTSMAASRTVNAFVTDFGTGLDEHHIDRLFEPFYTTKPEGLGMGLSISQTIIKAHGGAMEAWNNRQGGATFAFTLPANQGDPT